MMQTGFDVPLFYDRHFDVIRAATPRLVQEAYRLRYQVYCIEKSFEDPEHHIGAFETDADDDRSIHTLLLHRRTGEIAGTTRVILPDQWELRPLPMASLLEGGDLRFFRRLPLAHTAELSRFAVSKQFRQRRNEEHHADADLGAVRVMDTEKRLMPFISLGLIRGMFSICIEQGITHLTAVMEPPLIRILNRLGLEFTPIGGTVMHHGLRQPCFAVLGDLIKHAREHDTVVWQYAMEPVLRKQAKAREYAAA